MNSTVFISWIMWVSFAQILPAGSDDTEYSTVELERFGDSATGSGRAHYAKISNAGCELTIELGLLRPGKDYWLCLNAVFPDNPENAILGNLKPKSPDWPEGQFYDNPVTGEKEGFWNFATITADEYGTFSGTFLLPLPPREGAYSVKLLVKEIYPKGDVILQAPLLRFTVKSSAIRWAGIFITAVLLSISLAVVLLRFRHKRAEKKNQEISPTLNDDKKIGLETANIDETASFPRRGDKKTRRIEWIVKAMLLVKDHPEWTDKKIAEEVKIDPAQLSRCQEYQKCAKEVRCGDPPPKGYLRINPETRQQDTEAYSEEDDTIEN
jgi:hypothetical protein